MHRNGLGHRHHRDDEGLVRVLHQHVGREALGMQRVVGEPEDQEEEEGEADAEILAQPQLQVTHVRHRRRLWQQAG